MSRSIRNNSFLLLVCLLLTACSGTSHLPKGEKLYTGAVIKLESAEKLNKRLIKTVIDESVRPAPNKGILGFRPKLWLYNLAGEDPGSKFGKWLKKTGEAPVLMSSVKPGVTSAIIDARLFNIGIFKSFTESGIVEKKHTAKVIYTSHLHKPYVNKELSYAISDDSMSQVILAEKDQSLIKPGEDYNLEILRNERKRIDAFLKNKGYFNFSPDYLLFKADTSDIFHDVAFKITLKEDIPENALTVYRINNVYINQDYSLDDRPGRTGGDTVLYENNIFLGREARMAIRPKVLSKSIYLRKGEVFSRLNHLITLNRLMSMGNFKLVQVNFTENNDSGPGLLDVQILMTPMPKRTFRAEAELVSKSNNYSGPRLNLSLLDRNSFNGAELLNLKVAGSFEAQLTGVSKNLYAYSLNPELALTFPRILVPFKIKPTNSIYIPKTTLSFSFNYLKKVEYFDMRTFRFTYGFNWKEDIRKGHEFNPVQISYTSVSNQSAAFKELLASNPFLKKSYEEQFIAGSNYSFTYNEQVISGKKMQYFLLLTSELAGNMFSLANIISGKNISSDHPSRIAGSVYSQFAKLSIDSRGLYHFNDKNKLALRILAGAGKPFGNSSVMPYTKQFFSGGPNSLRAFQISSVGPGTYNQNIENRGFLLLGGDIKLEMNAEYRFGIYRFLRGALFMDAGNVWLFKSNPENFGSHFQFSRFMNEVAVGTGAGLRIDVSFFILRFDLAMPLRKPWLEENQRWVTNQISFGDRSWRRENLVLNVAIGYPF